MKVMVRIIYYVIILVVFLGLVENLRKFFFILSILLLLSVFEICEDNYLLRYSVV